MKKEQILELIKNNVELPEGVDAESVKFNIDNIAEQVNNSTNDIVKAEASKASEKAQKELLSKHGFESVEDFEKALQKEPEDEDKLEKLSQKIEQLEQENQEKAQAIQTREQKDVLKSQFKIKDNHLDRAHKLITSELGEDGDFEEIAKKFTEEVPEWTESEEKQPKNFGSDKDGEGDNPDTNPFAEAFNK